MVNNAMLAVLVILSFVFVGFAIGQNLFWLAGLLFFSGFALMSVGLRRKRRRDEVHAD